MLINIKQLIKNNNKNYIFYVNNKNSCWNINYNFFISLAKKIFNNKEEFEAT